MTSKVLLVDDSMMVRKQVGQALEQAGFETIEAVDGVDALEKLQGAPDIRLILCDVNMPRMNGMELLEQLAADGIPVPVVMLTSEGQPELMQRAKALGAKGWIIKPFKADLVVATARKLTAGL